MPVTRIVKNRRNGQVFGEDGKQEEIRRPQRRYGRTGGTTVRGYSCCPESCGIFPADTLDFGGSISDGLRTDVDKVMPRWGGHGLSWPPDSGIGLGSDGRTRGRGLGRFDQSTFWPTIPQLTRRKRRAGGRVMTDSDMGLDVMLERTQRVRRISGPCLVLVVVRVSRQLATWRRPRMGGRPRTISQRELGLREWVLQMWWRACRRRWRISGRNPGMIAPGRHRFRPSIRAGTGLRQKVYLCLRVRLVGISTDKCLRPLSVSMDGMV